MKPRVLLAAPLDEPSEARLRAAADVIVPREHTEDAICAAIGDCDGLIGRTHTPVTRRVLDAGTRLRVVGVAGVGLDRVDLAAARERGVEVVHTPEASSDAVAELTLGLILELLRPIGWLAAAYRAGRFAEARREPIRPMPTIPSVSDANSLPCGSRAGRFAEARREPHGSELASLTLGIVGMGRIGSRVGRIAAAGFGARVLFSDIVEIGPLGYAAERVPLDELLAAADVVSLHVPLTDATRGMIGSAALSKMKPTALLINTARGEVVETAALTDALRRGRLGGAALDVTPPEPLPAEHALFGFPNVILTPHIAARTHEGLRRMCEVADRVIEALQRTTPR
jgi:D-3-phosphoglycerate dehydrogenase / 2-oxoglutarate reductase